MADFIARIRAEEAQQDEEEYWKTHTFARYRRDVKQFLSHTVETLKATQADIDAKRGKGGGSATDEHF